MPTELIPDYIPGQAAITLGADTTNSDVSWTVVVPSGLTIPTIGASNGQIRGLVDNEFVIFTAGTVTAGTRTWTVARAQGGSTGAIHTSGTAIVLDLFGAAFANTVQLSPSAQQSGNVNVSGSITAGSLVVPHASTHDLTGTDPVRDITRLAAGPAMNGYTAWAYDPGFITTNFAPSAGTVYLSKILTAHAYTINTIDFSCNTAGTGVTALANCFIGIYDSGGTRRFVSADQSSSWATNGVKSIAVAGGYVVTANDFIYLAVFVGTQSTTTFKLDSNGATLFNTNLSAATYRFARQALGGTSLPSSLTLSSNINDAHNTWYGVR